MNVTLGYVTKRGGHVTMPLNGDKLEAELKKLFARRTDATAWQTENRQNEVGWVWKLDARWTWAMDSGVVA